MVSALFAVEIKNAKKGQLKQKFNIVIEHLNLSPKNTSSTVPKHSTKINKVFSRTMKLFDICLDGS